MHAGVKAIYLSGSSLSSVSLGLPDLGVINASDVAEDTRRITACCPLPLLVDIDTGLSDTALGIRRTVQQVERAGACGVHLEDQRFDQKRCGHRPNKSLVSIAEMADRIRAAVSARDDPAFVIMARTDSLASESAADAAARITAYTQAGADMIFLEAAQQLSDYGTALSSQQHPAPLLANMTEFGVTPPFTLSELGSVGVSMALFPISAQRMMAKACLTAYEQILTAGTSKHLLPEMQTRQELYTVLDYARYEQEMDDAAK